MKKTITSSLLAASLLLCSCGNADKVAKELMDSVIKDSLRKDSVKKAENERHKADSIFSAHQSDSIDKASEQAARMGDSAKKK